MAIAACYFVLLQLYDILRLRNNMQGHLKAFLIIMDLLVII